MNLGQKKIYWHQLAANIKYTKKFCKAKYPYKRDLLHYQLKSIGILMQD